MLHTLCVEIKKSYSCTGTVTFNIPHHSAAPLRPVSDYRTLLSPQKNTKTNVISQTSCQTAFRSRCTAPCWVNTVRHTHTHTHSAEPPLPFYRGRYFSLGTAPVLLLLKISFLTRSDDDDDDVNNNPVRCYNPEWSVFGPQTPWPFCPISLVFLKQFATRTLQRQRNRDDRRQNGHNDSP